MVHADRELVLGVRPFAISEGDLLVSCSQISTLTVDGYENWLGSSTEEPGV